MVGFPRLEDVNVTNKTVLVRTDLNVPMQAGRVTDATRINRIVPTLQYLMERHAKVVILSHLGRPKGFDPALSLAPLVDALSAALWDRPVRFAPDCVGNAARLAHAERPGDERAAERERLRDRLDDERVAPRDRVLQQVGEDLDLEGAEQPAQSSLKLMPVPKPDRREHPDPWCWRQRSS